MVLRAGFARRGNNVSQRADGERRDFMAMSIELFLAPAKAYVSLVDLR